jgi:hypothetical protein
LVISTPSIILPSFYFYPCIQLLPFIVITICPLVLLKGSSSEV